MPSYTFDGVNDQANIAADVVGSNVFTVAFWCRSNSFAANSVPFVIGVSTSNNNNNRVELKTTGAVAAATRLTGSTNEAQTTANMSVDTWHHVCAVFASATDRRAFLDGANKGTNTTSTIPTGQNLTRFGTHADASSDFTGQIAYPCIWNVALDDDEVAMLGAGRCWPTKVRPGSIVAFWENFGRDSVDTIGGNDLTLANNTAFSAEEPPIQGRLAGAQPFSAELATAAAPTFDVSPTIQSQTDTAYTIAYDADANATNIYVGAYAKDATAPTAAQLKAGTGARGTATEATTGASDTIVLTPTDSPAFPLYDVYAVLEGAGGFSSVVALTDEFLDPPAGKQFVTLDTLSGTAVPTLVNADPPISVGDIWVLDTDSTPNGYDITAFDTGDYSMVRGGDTSRQSFTHDVYDVSLAAYYGEGTVYDLNVAPQFNGGGAGFFDSAVYKKDEDQGEIDLGAEWSDTEGDDIDYAVQSGSMPNGWSLDGETGVITNAPTAYGTFNFTIRATDSPPGDYTDQAEVVIIGDEVPDVVGETEANAIAAIEAVANFLVDSVAYTSSSSVPAGNVISQFPEAGEYVVDDQEFLLIVSTGRGSGTGSGKINIKLSISI